MARIIHSHLLFKSLLVEDFYNACNKMLVSKIHMLLIKLKQKKNGKGNGRQVKEEKT